MNITNLPKYMIQRIINDIEFAADAISLFLAVKSLYLERNQYRLFIKDEYSPIRCRLNSFKTIIAPSSLSVSSHDITDVIKSCGSLDSLSTLYWDTCFLKLCQLPRNVMNLSLLNCGDNITEGYIPNTVKTLTLINVNPKVGIIPKSVKSLSIRNTPKIHGVPFPPNVIPDSVEYLYYNCNLSLADNSLPRESIKTLKLGDDFKKRLLPGSIPPSVTSLSLGIVYSQPIEPGVLPNTIQHLKMGGYNLPITGTMFPMNLRTLAFEGRFSQNITALSTLTSIEDLHLGTNFFHQIAALPPILTSLTLPEPYECSALELKQLLPQTLRKLTLVGWNHPLTEPGILPSSLTYLSLSNRFDSEIAAGCLPKDLKVLILSTRFNKPLGAGALPDGIERLVLGENFNQPIEAGVLPKSLKHLELGQQFNQNIIPSSLPDSLEYLVFGENFNQPLQVGSLSSTKLHTIHFGMYFEQTLTAELLPATLEHIHFKLAIMINPDKSKIKSPFKIKPKTRTQIIGFFKDIPGKKKSKNNNNNNNNNIQLQPTKLLQPKITLHSHLHFFALESTLKSGTFELSSVFYFLLDNAIGFDMVLMGTATTFHVRPYKSHVLLLNNHLECGFIKTSKLRDFSIGKTIGTKLKLLFI